VVLGRGEGATFVSGEQSAAIVCESIRNGSCLPGSAVQRQALIDAHVCFAVTGTHSTQGVHRFCGARLETALATLPLTSPPLTRAP
jgi:hypothetical protein